MAGYLNQSGWIKIFLNQELMTFPVEISSINRSQGVQRSQVDSGKGIFPEWTGFEPFEFDIHFNIIGNTESDYLNQINQLKRLINASDPIQIDFSMINKWNINKIIIESVEIEEFKPKDTVYRAEGVLSCVEYVEEDFIEITAEQNFYEELINSSSYNELVDENDSILEDLS